MNIVISDLIEGEFFYNFVEDTGKLNLNIPELYGNIILDIRLVKSRDFILVNAAVSGIMKFECDRCTEIYEHRYENTFELLYRFKGLRYENISGNEDVNVYYINKDDREIDITEPLRDYLLLTIPMKKNPEEKDGVCLFCKRKIDDILKIIHPAEENPVWEKLKKIKKL